MRGELRMLIPVQLRKRGAGAEAGLRRYGLKIGKNYSNIGRYN